MAAKRKEPSPLHEMRFPGESADYRAARDRLLHEEAALRRHIEEVAALRRSLPLGGPVAEDYVFEEGAADLDDATTVRKVRLSDSHRGSWLGRFYDRVCLALIRFRKRTRTHRQGSCACRSSRARFAGRRIVFVRRASVRR